MNMPFRNWCVLKLDDTAQLLRSEIIYLCRVQHQLTFGLRGGGSLTISYPSAETAQAKHAEILAELGWTDNRAAGRWRNCQDQQPLKG